VGEGFHDGETYIPMAYLVNRGAEVHVIGVAPAKHAAYNSDITAHVHKSVEDVSVDDFDGMVIPGGRSPDWLRNHEAVVKFAGAFYKTGKPVAAICHGPQVLIAAGVVDGVKATCFPGMSDELKQGGADYVDVPVARDGNLITSRVPDDIPAFCAAFKEALLE
jgi:protease I